MRFSIFYLQVDTCFFFEFCNLGFDVVHGSLSFTLFFYSSTQACACIKCKGE